MKKPTTEAPVYLASYAHDSPLCAHWGFCQTSRERGQREWKGCPVDCTHRQIKDPK